MTTGVRRSIVGFHPDDEGQWVAELSCLHNQHVRHQPPFEDRPWTLDDKSRAERLGSPIECPLCMRGEAPTQLRHIRTAGPFDEMNMPSGLRERHEIVAGRWGLLRIREGSALLVFDEYSIEMCLNKGDERAIPPAMVHHLEVTGHVLFEIDFLAPADDPT